MSSRQSNGPDDGFEVPVPDAAAVAGVDPVVFAALWLAVVCVWLVADAVPEFIWLEFVVVAVAAVST